MFALPILIASVFSCTDRWFASTQIKWAEMPEITTNRGISFDEFLRVVYPCDDAKLKSHWGDLGAPPTPISYFYTIVLETAENELVRKISAGETPATVSEILDDLKGKIVFIPKYYFEEYSESAKFHFRVTLNKPDDIVDIVTKKTYVGVSSDFEIVRDELDGDGEVEFNYVPDRVFKRNGENKKLNQTVTVMYFTQKDLPKYRRRAVCQTFAANEVLMWNQCEDMQF